MNKKAFILIVLIAGLAISGCIPGFTANQTIVTGSGNLTSENRPVSGFSQIALNGLGNVTVVVGSEESLVVEAEDNLIQYITTEVHGSNLVIGTKNGFQILPKKEIKYKVILKSVEGLTIGGAGNITADNLNLAALSLGVAGTGNIQLAGLQADSLNVQISGAGSIKVDGQSTDLTVGLSGAGNFQGADFKNSTTNVTISGTGNASVWSTGSLSVTISGAGSIQYYGNPNVTKTITGLGIVNDMGDHS